MSDLDEELLRAVDELSLKASLSALDIVECHAVRSSPDAAGGFTSELETGISPVEGGLVVRFALTTTVTTGDGGSQVGEIKVLVGLAYTIADLPDPQGAVVGNFVARSAFRDAYPYLRENTHELAARLGLLGVILSTLAVHPTYQAAVPIQETVLVDDTQGGTSEAV